MKRRIHCDGVDLELRIANINYGVINVYIPGYFAGIYRSGSINHKGKLTEKQIEGIEQELKIVQSELTIFHKSV